MFTTNELLIKFRCSCSDLRRIVYHQQSQQTTGPSVQLLLCLTHGRIYSRSHGSAKHTTTTTLLDPFNGLSSTTTWVSRYQNGNTSLDLQQARDGGVMGCRGISWTICKQSAPRSRQITTPTPHHSIIYRPDALPDAQPTASKH